MTSLAINTKGVTGIKPASIQSPAPSSDQIVGNYRLGKTIGQGTYGKVKIASDIRTGQKVRRPWNQPEIFIHAFTSLFDVVGRR